MSGTGDGGRKRPAPSRPGEDGGGGGVAKRARVPARKKERKGRRNEGQAGGSADAALCESVEEFIRTRAPARATVAQIGRAVGSQVNEQLLTQLNVLLKASKIKLFERSEPGNQGKVHLEYEWVPREERTRNRARMAKLRGLTPAALSIYKEIEQAGSKGLGMRDLKYKTNLQASAIRKLLEAMAARSLIKWVRTIEAKNKKIWLLQNVQPSREVEGGPWYDDGIFDEQVVDALYKGCMGILQSKGPQTAQQVTRVLVEAGLLNGVTIDTMDTEYILQALVLDGQAEVEEKSLPPVKVELRDGGGAPGAAAQNRKLTLYRIKDGGLNKSPYTTIPCAVCPVAVKCAEGLEVSPEKCKYLAKWMQF